MSYNSYGYLKDIIFFTELDLLALIEIWGVEISNSKKKNTENKDNKKSIKNNSLFQNAFNKAQKGDHFEAVSLYNKI